ncbi:helix-turn-helix transcriptional regulator [Nonomuraea glycinis]|uniref:helix-turn-helix transcriptional regulator n=1 Tax=Nonomuraea glycinis TaxID=2047744 RepID=UPI002E0E5E12|nr:helix-turn-helix domain-containing protein [Nonomuraea glycinis]
MRTKSEHDLERHLTIEDLAERMQVPVLTVYRWNSARTGPRYFKAGRHCRYKLTDVIAWENANYADGAA